MFVNLVMEGDTDQVDCTKDQLGMWISGLMVPFTTARDPDSASLAIKNLYGERETTYVVERATMKIVSVDPDAPTGMQTIQGLQ